MTSLLWFGAQESFLWLMSFCFVSKIIRSAGAKPQCHFVLPGKGDGSVHCSASPILRNLAKSYTRFARFLTKIERAAIYDDGGSSLESFVGSPPIN